METISQVEKKQKNSKKVITALALGFFAVTLFPFLPQILLAVVMAFAIQPILDKMNSIKFFRARRSTNFFLGGLLSLIVLVFVSVIIVLYARIYHLVQTRLNETDLTSYVIGFKQSVIENLNQFLGARGVTLDTSNYLNQGITKAVQVGTSFISSMFYSLPAALMSLFVFLFFLYMFSRQAGRIKEQLTHSQLLSREELEGYIHLLQDSSYSSVIASIVTGAAQAGIVTVGALFMGTSGVLLIFVIAFLFSFVPIFGATSVALMLSLITYFSGDATHAVAYLVVAGLCAVSDNFIRPFLVRDKANSIHPLLMLIIIFSALEVFGFIGLFIAPVIAIFAVTEFKRSVLGIAPKEKT